MSEDKMGRWETRVFIWCLLIVDGCFSKGLAYVVDARRRCVSAEFVVLNVLDDSMPSLAQWWLCERLNHVTFTYVTHTRSSRDVTWLHRPSGDSCRASFQLS